MPPLRSFVAVLVLLVVVVPAQAWAESSSLGAVPSSHLSKGALWAVTLACFVPLLYMLLRQRHRP